MNLNSLYVILTDKLCNFLVRMLLDQCLPKLDSNENIDKQIFFLNQNMLYTPTIRHDMQRYEMKWQSHSHMHTHTYEQHDDFQLSWIWAIVALCTQKAKLVQVIKNHFYECNLNDKAIDGRSNYRHTTLWHQMTPRVDRDFTSLSGRLSDMFIIRRFGEGGGGDV